MTGRAGSLQGPFEISTPGTAPFHFSRPLDLPLAGNALPDDGTVLPVAGPAPLTQIAVPADPTAMPRNDLTGRASEPEDQPPEDAERRPEPAREDVEMPPGHLAAGEQGQIPAEAPDAALVPLPIVARSTPSKLPTGTRMTGPVPVREATIVPVAQEQQAQRVIPVQANSELPVLAAGVVSHSFSPGMEDASEQGFSSGASSVFLASSAPSVNAATSAVAAASAEPRAVAELEAAIEHLAEAREAGRAARSQVTLSHQEFGAISLKIDASGNDLRATLASRDPGFVPAIQAALAERGISASGEAGSTQSQRGGEQANGQQGQSQQGNPGGGGTSDPRYGFSSGSGNASNLPYRDQNGASKDEQGGPTRSREGDDPESESAQGGLFA